MVDICFALQEEEIENVKKDLAELQGLFDTGKLSSQGQKGGDNSAELENVMKENEKLKMRIEILKRVSVLALLFSE